MSARWAAVAGIAWSLLSGPGAHASGLHYRVWTIEDGLPTGSVRALAQTADGYLWIATLDGLVRFDGVRMRLFQRSEYRQMTSNRCLSLLVDRTGDLWVGTEDGGLLRVRGHEVRAFGTADGLPSLRTGWLAEDAAGRLWAATAEGPVVRDGERFRRVPPATPVPRIEAERWVLQDGYLRRRDGESWVTFPDPVPAAILSRPNDLFEDREGTLWIGGDGGLVQASPTAVRALVPELDANVYTLAPDRQGASGWARTTIPPCGTAARRLHPPRGQSWWPREQDDHHRAAERRDAPGRRTGGLFRVWPGRRSERIRAEAGESGTSCGTATGRSGSPSRAASCGRPRTAGSASKASPPRTRRCCWSRGTAASGSGRTAGVSRLAQGTLRTWTEADGLSSNSVRSLHEDASGTLWIGTYDGGLEPLRRRQARRPSASGTASSTTASSPSSTTATGRFWMSSNRGVYAVGGSDLDAFASGTLAARRLPGLDGASTACLRRSATGAASRPASARTTARCGSRPSEGSPSSTRAPCAANTTPPPVVIEEITTDRRSIPVGPSVELAPGERRLEVRYTANTFVRPGGDAVPAPARRLRSGLGGGGQPPLRPVRVRAARDATRCR